MFRDGFPLVYGGDHLLCSGGYAPCSCNSERLPGKAHYFCGQSKCIQSTGKMLFTPLMKSVITSVICAGDEMLLRSAGKCSILPVLQSFAKRASMTWTRICSTGSSQFLSLPCHSGISPNLFKDYLENCVYVWRVWRVKTSVVFI